MNKEILKNNFQSYYQRLLIDARQAIHTSSIFSKRLRKYQSIAKRYIQVYQHHQGSSVSATDLEERFLHETAILHATKQTFGIWLNCLHQSDIEINWTISEAHNLYDWFTPSDDLFEDHQLSQIDFQVITADLGVWLADQGDNLLSQGGRRYLGEFYTPVMLTEHLLDIAKFSVPEFLNGANLVDPACGSGNILAEALIRILDYAQENRILDSALLQECEERIYGYDIQPFAVSLTRMVLLYISCVYLKADDINQLKTTTFPNVRLSDPLAESEETWHESGQKFNFVIGNPPFMSVKREFVPHIDAYAEIISGHANLYTMFLWWAVRSSKPKGMISFLLPQSMLIGPYFSKIRTRLEENTHICSITRLLDRTGVVGEADQQMMVLALEVNDHPTKNSYISLRVVRNGDSIMKATPVSLPYRSIVSEIDGEIIWQISDDPLDFEIMAALEAKCCELGKLKNFIVGTGNFVWNQHKDLIQVSQVSGSIPLISSASVSKFGFQFPYSGKHDTANRQYAVVDREKTEKKKHSGDVVLIKRTTPRKVGRRLIAGMLTDSFCTENPAYFLENHVNYVKLAPGVDKSLLYGLLGWLNSDVINFIFQLRNGSTQVSVFEIKLLPANLELINRLSPLVKKLLGEPDIRAKQKLEAQMNQMISKELNLNKEHKARIEKMLKLREKSTQKTNN